MKQRMSVQLQGLQLAKFSSVANRFELNLLWQRASNVCLVCECLSAMTFNDFQLQTEPILPSSSEHLDRGGERNLLALAKLTKGTLSDR